MHRRRVLRVAGAALGAGVVGRRGTGRARGQSGDDAEDGDATGGSGGGYGPLGSVAVAGTREAVVSGDGTVAYLALGDGYATVDLSDPSDPTVLAERRDLLPDRPDGPLDLLNDAKVSGDRLVVVGPAHPGRELPHGVLIVDVSDPAAPRDVGFYATDFPIHNCDLDGRHCYLTGNDGDANPLVVVDLDAASELARWSVVDVDESWRDVRSGLRTVHDVTVRNGVAALAYWDAGTYLLDVSDPAAPAFLGSVDPGDPADLRSPPPREGTTPPGNHHYSQLSPDGDVLAVGRETWAVEYDGDVLGGPSGVDLYDVSDPSDPALVSSVDPPSAPDSTFAGTWTTAHNLDLREDTLYTSWYQGGVKRHDVSDPAAPVEETWWADPADTRFWTARLAVPGEYFVASSMGARGGDGADAGLWTFPDGPGTGGDRSRFGTAAATATAPATPTATATSSTADTSTAGGTASHAAGPGFGAVGTLGALAGVAGGAALAVRRTGRRTGADRDDE
ncbi:LVIVD repeat-containing protein [Halobaculum lipolyticum]|uniref:LVIVD repeat-containing protein n=1 Tax=Halobaculum lipolyticum TaxID=3032001 RepID=UPI0024C27A6C|nr:hypothetical protein [Halobaculum sp. DT31]